MTSPRVRGYPFLAIDTLKHKHWRRQLWGTGARAPLDLQQLIFRCTLTCTKSDSDYMSTVASCKNAATFVCAPPGISALEIFLSMRYINSLLLTYLLTYQILATPLNTKTVMYPAVGNAS